MYNHIRVTHMLISFECEVAGCGAVISGKAGYRGHVRRNHRNIGEGEFNALLEKIKKIPVPIPELDQDKLPQNNSRLAPNHSSKRTKPIKLKTST